MPEVLSVMLIFLGFFIYMAGFSLPDVVFSVVCRLNKGTFHEFSDVSLRFMWLVMVEAYLIVNLQQARESRRIYFTIFLFTC